MAEPSRRRIGGTSVELTQADHARSAENAPPCSTGEIDTARLTPTADIRIERLVPHAPSATAPSASSATPGGYHPEGARTPSGASSPATLDDAAAGPADRVGVSWSEHHATGGVLSFAALRTGGTWDAPAGLGAPGQAGLAGSRIAFSSVSGEALVVRGELTAGTPGLAASSSPPG